MKSCLSGKTLDTNSHFLAKSLFKYGIELKRIEIVPDEMEAIISTVQRLNSQYDYIFTSGGIGPTHDDITYEAIAKSFQDRLILHEPSLERYRSMSSNEMTPARLRMVTLPSQGSVIFTPHLWVPLCIVDSVHILPGVPQLFESMLQHYLPTLKQTSRFFRRLVSTFMVEGDLAEKLTQLQHMYPHVKLGSYPTYGTEEKDRKGNVTLSVVGTSLHDVENIAILLATTFQGEIMDRDKNE